MIPIWGDSYPLIKARTSVTLTDINMEKTIQSNTLILSGWKQDVGDAENQWNPYIW
jgi:hypothetical protein